MTSDGNHNQMGPPAIMNSNATVTTQQLAALFEDFMQFGSVGLHIVDNEGIILWANQAELDLLGYTREEYFGKPISDFHVDAGKLNNILGTLLAGDKVLNVIAPIRAKDGHTEYVEINSSMRQIRGQCVTTRCFSACVTDRVLKEQAQLQAALQREEAARMQEETRRKSKFLRQLCHELRNPLGGVMGNLDLLVAELKDAASVPEKEETEEKESATGSAIPIVRNDPSEDYRTRALVAEQKLATMQQHVDQALEYAQSAQLAAEHQMMVINDTLSLSRLESPSFEVSPEPVDLSSLLKTVLAILGVQAQEKGISVQVDLAQTARFVRTDTVWMKQILINLLSNALKFTDQGGRVSIKIDVIRQHQSPMLQVTVQDTGIGMTPEEQGKLFGAFAQANERISSQFGGSGLGLHIVKQLLEHIGGTIVVESEKGVGSTFLVSLPCDLLTPDERVSLLIGPNSIPNIDTKPSRCTSRPLEALPRTATKQNDHTRVLIVDDNSINRKLLASFLGKKGYRYELAENGQVALELHQQSPFDVILTDIDMPVMDGFEMTRQIRQQEQASQNQSTKGYRCAVPIIGISGNVFPADVASAENVGINEYIGKPFKFPKLEALILKYISRSCKNSVGGQLERKEGNSSDVRIGLCSNAA